MDKFGLFDIVISSNTPIADAGRIRPVARAGINGAMGVRSTLWQADHLGVHQNFCSAA
jgi:hypothetical protein